MSVRGVLKKAYRNTGNWATPTWNEVPLFNELTVGLNWTTGPVMSRETTAEREAPSTVKLDVQGNMRQVLGDADYEAIRAATLAATPLDMMFLTGAHNTNTEVGFRADWLSKTLTDDQGASVGHGYDALQFAPHGLSNNFPQSVVVTGGVPVFTAF
jgi:hypothetical protein